MPTSQAENKTNNEGKDTPPESSTENKTGNESSQPDGGEKKPDDTKKVIPFHEDPKVQDYLQRQWEQKEQRLRQEFEDKISGIIPPKKEEDSEIPEWFGGDLKQWKAFQKHQSKMVEDAENKAFEKLTKFQQANQKAIEEANQWFDDSINNIESQSGESIDRNALLDIVLKNELIDSKGRWNYKAGYEILKAQKGTSNNSQNKDRKKLADATTKDSNKGGKETVSYKTSEDFKKPGERPW